MTVSEHRTGDGLGQLRRYHDATKHTALSVATGGRTLDWSNKPLAFKIYRDLEGLTPPDDLARLCLLSNGVLRWRRWGAQEYGFRAAPCTGALYHVELYLATAQRDDLPAGLYHYGAHDHGLRRLRAGDVRGVLAGATGGFEPISGAPLVAILTSTFWRNAWKYEARAYRHAFWDSGAVVANMLALLAADGQPAAVDMGFADAGVNHLLGVDGARETTMVLVAVGEGAPAPPATERPPNLELLTEPLSRHEVRYREIEAAHQASSLATGGEATAWRRTTARALDGAAAQAVPAPLFDARVDEVIRARRSTRQFSADPITREQLAAVLEAATLPIPGDVFSPGVVEPFLIINAVDGLEPGAYGPDLRRIRSGRFRRTAAELALWQELAGLAAANVYFLADLDVLLRRLGGRGYRVAQIAGGIAGGRIELAATALGLGATGLTFFDDDVNRFFQPAAAGRQVMYLAAVGRRSR